VCVKILGDPDPDLSGFQKPDRSGPARGGIQNRDAHPDGKGAFQFGGKLTRRAGFLPNSRLTADGVHCAERHRIEFDGYCAQNLLRRLGLPRTWNAPDGKYPL